MGTQKLFARLISGKDLKSRALEGGTTAQSADKSAADRDIGLGLRSVVANDLKPEGVCRSPAMLLPGANYFEHVRH